MNGGKTPLSTELDNAIQEEMCTGHEQGYLQLFFLASCTARVRVLISTVYDESLFFLSSSQWRISEVKVALFANYCTL